MDTNCYRVVSECHGILLITFFLIELMSKGHGILLSATK